MNSSCSVSSNPLVFAISHILVMWYVQCKPLLLWHSHVKMWTHYKRLKPWRMYFMLLGVSQLMLHTSHSASCKVHVTHGAVQTGRWVGKSMVGTFVQTGREENQRGMYPDSKSGRWLWMLLSAASTFEDDCVCFFGFQEPVVYFSNSSISKQTAVLVGRASVPQRTRLFKHQGKKTLKLCYK